MPSVELPTNDRLIFRLWRADDLAYAEALWGDPSVTALIEARGALRREHASSRLRDEMAHQRAFGVQYWPIFAREDDGFVGCCGLRDRDRVNGVFELGFHIRSACWGRGFATGAGLAVVSFAFGPFGAQTLFAGHHPENAASGRVLEKLGFVYSHTQRYEATGLDHPSYLLTASQYAASPGTAG